MVTRLVVHLATDAVRLAIPADDGGASPVDAPGLAAPGELGRFLAKWAGDTLSFRSQVTVHFQGPLVQERRLHGLPRVAPAQLERVVRFEPHRYFRRSRDELVVGARWASPDRSTAMVVALPAAWVDAAFASLSRYRLLTVAGQAGITVVSPVAAEAAQQRLRRASLVLGALALSLWLAAPVTWLVRLQIRERELQQSLAARAEATEALVRARRRMDQVQATTSTLSAARDSALAVASWIATVVRGLPDSSYISTVALDAQGTGRVEGMALDPVDALGRLRSILPGRTLQLGGQAGWSGENSWAPISFTITRPHP